MQQKIFRQAEIAVLTPNSMGEVKAGADEIKAGTPLIINFSNLNSEEKFWAIHFLNGVIYALDGNTLELSQKVFLFAPRDVVVSRE